MDDLGTQKMTNTPNSRKWNIGEVFAKQSSAMILITFVTHPIPTGKISHI